MGIVRNEIEITDSDPFANDKLGRKETAEKLTGLLKGADGPLVISVNGRWGTGKTTFIRMWDQMLRHEDIAKSLTFNAWENDFFADPSVAFIDEITTSLSEDDRFDRSIKQEIAQLKETASALIPILLDFAVGSRTAGAVENLLEEYEKEKTRIVDFKDDLATVATEVVNESGAPLFLFVDELDRCRPDFAVKLLEQIKHLFDVPGIVFVLSVDLEQLKGSIKSLYGEEMDANGYLRRFIDLRYQLPRPEGGNYVNYLFSKNGTDDCLFGSGNQELEMARCCSDHYNLSLRGKEHYMLRVDLAFRQLDSGPGLPPSYFRVVTPFLVALRMKEYELYQSLLRGDSRDAGIEEARRFTLGKLGMEIGSMKPENLLEAAVRTLCVDDSNEFESELKMLRNKLGEVSQTDSSSTEDWSEKVDRERRLKGVRRAMRRISSDGGVELMDRTREAVELAGSIDRI